MGLFGAQLLSVRSLNSSRGSLHQGYSSKLDRSTGVLVLVSELEPIAITILVAWFSPKTALATSDHRVIDLLLGHFSVIEHVCEILASLENAAFRIYV